METRDADTTNEKVKARVDKKGNNEPPNPVLPVSWHYQTNPFPGLKKYMLKRLFREGEDKKESNSKKMLKVSESNT